MTAMTTAKVTRIQAGEYRCKGYTIYRMTSRPGAYNPWKVSFAGRTFATLAQAVTFVQEQCGDLNN